MNDEATAKAVPLPEYPRPQMVRDSYLPLNGPWDYAISDSRALRALYAGQIRPAKRKGLAAAILSQLSDVEDERSGLVSYDRSAVKLAPAVLREIVNMD